MAEYSRAHRWLAVVAGTLAALAAVAGAPPAPERSDSFAGETPYVTALELARWMRDGKPAVRILDVRSAAEFAEYHLPRAEHVGRDALARGNGGSADTVVVYASDDTRSAEAARRLRSRGAAAAYVLRGGLRAWIDQIVEPRLAALPASATPKQRTARREHLELSRYFGGMPVVAPSSVPLPRRTTPSEAAAVGRILRRGC
jgi:rhodanese-related sulfurtransferase